MPLTDDTSEKDTSPEPGTFSQDLGFFLEEFAFVLRIKQRKIAPMEDYSLQLRVRAIPIRRHTHLCPVESIEKCEKSDLLSLCVQLLGNLVRDGSTQAVASNKIGAFRLYLPNLIDV